VQSSVVGGALICSEALGVAGTTATGVEEVHPRHNKDYSEKYREWKDVRASFKQTLLEEVI
jgi:autoinducer 2 (AI-2) kinase